MMLGNYTKLYDEKVYVKPVAVQAAGDKYIVDIEVWNTFYEPRVLTEIVGADVLSGDIDVEHAPFEPYLFKVSLNQIKSDTSLEFYFDDFISSAALFASEISDVFEDVEQEPEELVIHWPIDWSELPVLNNEWTTEVLENFDGSEQRISLRETPRQQIVYNFKNFNERQHEFDNLIYDHVGPIFLPLWFDEATIHGYIKEGMKTIELTKHSDILASSERAFITDGESYEIVEIASYADQEITTKDLVKRNYSDNVRIMPAALVRIADSNDSYTYSNKITGGIIAFEVEDNDTPSPSYSDDFERLEGIKILPFIPDRSLDVSQTFNRLRETFDPMLGSKHVYERTNQAIRHVSYDFTFFNRNDIQRFKNFENIMKGAQGEFYFEGPATLTELTEDVSSISNKIKVKNTGSAQAIAIKLANGDTIHRAIKHKEKIVGGEIITLNAAISSLTKDDIDYIAPLHLGRFASDLFTYTYETSNICKITKIIKQLLYADPVVI